LKRYVFDSYPIFVYLEKENNWEEISQILKKALDEQCEIFLSAINWGEVYYITLRESGSEKAELYRKIMDAFPIEVVHTNEEQILTAARFKSFNKISYADAFAAALTQIKKATLVTGDKEFKQVSKSIKIEWI